MAITFNKKKGQQSFQLYVKIIKTEVKSFPLGHSEPLENEMEIMFYTCEVAISTLMNCVCVSYCEYSQAF